MIPLVGYATEIWKPVKGWDGLYEVSNLGRIKRTGKGIRAQVGRIKIPTLDACGYARVSLCDGGVKVTGKVHRIVLAAFVCESDKEANHKNGIRSDNRLENLEYMTHRENVLYSFNVLKSISRKGSKNGRAKLTESQAAAIRKRVDSGETQASLAREHGVDKCTISSLVRGATWV